MSCKHGRLIYCSICERERELWIEQNRMQEILLARYAAEQHRAGVGVPILSHPPLGMWHDLRSILPVIGGGEAAETPERK